MHLLINRNLHSTIFELSVPGMISSVLMTMFQLVDAYWIGKLGTVALAAISGSAFVIWALISLTAMSANGITTLVAQNIGGLKINAARLSAGHGLILNTGIAIALSVIVFLFQDTLFAAMGFSDSVSDDARQYLSIISAGLFLLFGFTGLEAVFRGLGDTFTPTLIIAITLVLNAILDPVFIFGWFGLPELKIGGAALATVLSHGVAVLICLYFLRKKHFNPDFKLRIEWPIIRRILSIGLPIATGGFIFSFIYIFLTNIISKFGMPAVAAIGIGHRIEGVAWFACVGFSVAAATLVGQNVGAGRIKEAQRAAWWVNGYGVIVLLIVSIIFYVFPAELMGIFTNDQIVRAYGVEYLRIVAIFEIFLGFEVIMEGAFSGAGYTLPVMLVNVPLSAARIPLAWYLSVHLDWGINGVWWAIALSTFLKGFINAILFSAGLWKRKIPDQNNAFPTTLA